MNSFRSKRPELPELPNDELEQYVKANTESFKGELLKNIEDFEQLVFSAEPNPTIRQENPEAYRLLSKNYRALLQMTAGITQRMQDSFNDIFTQYQQHVENLWETIFN